MFSARHPLWLVGFRPFFSLACLAGIVLPLLWILIFSGKISLPQGSLDPIRWHAHEMFYGFGWAVLGGFLLTSTKNWVNVRGHHGRSLMLLAAAWLFERATLAWGGAWPPAIALVGSYLFIGGIATLLLSTLVRHREQDSYRTDNRFFLIMLPAFLVAKTWLLFGTDLHTAYRMSLALFRLAFLVMLERTLTQFMKAAFQIQILRTPKLDLPIKLLGLMLALDFAFPDTLTVGLSLALAALLLIRLARWAPLRACTRIDIGIMFVGYLAIVGQLLLDAAQRGVGITAVGSVAVHLFTFGAMGCVIPAMIVRIANGHTGRKVVFQPADKAVLWLMLAALGVRIVLPQLFPAQYLACIHAAATLWAIAFAILAVRYIPILMQARIDGREH